MTERGILFSGAMVRALLDGTKTQTRRAVMMPPSWDCIVYADFGNGWWPYRSDDGESPSYDNNEIPLRCPYGQPGDRLWVRETCAGEELRTGQDGVRYVADNAFLPIKDSPSVAIDWLKLHTYGLKPGQRPGSLMGRKVPSIHMPRWASRILLEIVSARVERLQDISQRDAVAEGLVRLPASGRYVVTQGDQYFGLADPDPRVVYSNLWESLNGAGSWDANPWVWMVEFRRIEP